MTLKKNDYIMIKKSGGIIPKFLSVCKEKRKNVENFVISSKCYSCKSKLKYVGILTYCVNTECDAIKISQIVYFCSTKVLDIVGLGTKIIQQFYKFKYLQNIGDIYELKNKRERILQQNFDEKRMTPLVFDKIISAIEASKKQSYNKVLTALSIPFLGRANVQLITSKFSNINKLKSANLQDLENIDGIGPIAANAIFNFFMTLII